MTKKHIVFIPCGVLPIPAVRGGAVENLVWQLADLNERHVGYEMTVYSPYDAKAVERSMVYKHTRFSFIRTSGLPNKMLTAFYRACGEWHLFPVSVCAAHDQRYESAPAAGRGLA